jgi:hypothetical protein
MHKGMRLQDHLEEIVSPTKDSSVVMSSPLNSARDLLTVYFGTPSMFITLWFGFDYGTNPPLGILII